MSEELSIERPFAHYQYRYGCSNTQRPEPQGSVSAATAAAVVAVDKAVNKGILHKNNAARKKSSMTLKVNAMA